MRKRPRGRGLAYAVYAAKHGARGTFGSLAVMAAVLGAIAAVAAIALWTGGLLASEDPDPDRQERAAERDTPAVAAREVSSKQALEAYADLPLTFVENRGQTDERVRYHAQGPGYAFYFTPGEVVLSLVEGAGAAGGEGSSAEGVALGLRFIGANPDIVVEGEDRAPGETNYLRGDDPESWQTELPGYTSVVYRDLWPGIDMILHGQDGQLKYEFRVRPGAQPSDIQLAYAGADSLALDEAGKLLIETPLGELQDSPPVSYQEIKGERVPVESRYALSKDGGGEPGYGFAVANYQPDHELVIDPGVDYSSFLGGSSHEDGNGIAVDANGNTYIVGTTQSNDFPTTTGAFDRSFAGGVVDVFVSKLNADGSALVYSTYLGGTPTPLRRGTGDPFEFGRGIAVDENGNAYVTGQTTSSDFPTTPGAFQPSINVLPIEQRDDATDAFVTKLNAAGSGLVYSTFLGGTSFDDGRSIAIDGSGNAYVAGETDSNDLPTTSGAVQTTHSGGRDAFVSKLNADGSALAYSTFLGGADNEISNRVRVDGSSNAYVAGATRSADFPTTQGAFQPAHSGGASTADLFEAFVTKLSPNGSTLAYSTFLGGTRVDRVNGLDIDAAGNAYVVGGTLSPEFPTTPGAYDTVFDSTSESFATKLNANGSGLVYSTFLGGGGGAAITVDADNNAWVTGSAGAGAPTTPDGSQTQFGGGSTDAHLAKLNANGSALSYATFLGGTNSENGRDLALDSASNVYVTGTTFSTDFPTTQGAFDRTFSGDPAIFWGDAFVTKFGSGNGTTEPPPPPPASRTTTDFSGQIRNQTIAHTVSVGAAGPVDLNLNWSETRANLTLRALDPSGNVVFSAGGNARPKTGTFSAAVAGDYRFEVTNTTDRKTSYTLSVTHPVASSTDPEPAALTSLSLSPTSVTGGESSTGTVTLTSAAPTGGATVALSSSNTAAATVPANINVPAGSTNATFTVSTSSVSANTSSTISATYGGLSRTATLTVNAAATSPPSVTLSSLSLNPTTVTGGNSSTGTVTLTSAAPTGGATVGLDSSNTATATVPASVNVPAGQTSATFTVSTSSVTFDSSSAISASHGGVTRTVILSVNAPAATDTVSISRAEYDSGKRQLRVEASSSNSSATLRAYVTATDELIGTLSGGKGDFSWPTNPQNITVKSSLGGSATRTVTVK